MTRTLPQTFAAFAALLVVTMTWLPTVATPGLAIGPVAAAGPVADGTVHVVSLA